MADCPGVHKLALTRDGALARIRLPGGSLTASQLQTIAALAAKEGNGCIDLTNRANLQIRGLSEHRAAVIASQLAEADLLCLDASADRLRNITASPLSGLDTTALLNVRELIPAIDAAISTFPQHDAVSVKFSIVLGDGGRSPMTTVAHDLAFHPEKHGGRTLIRLWLAGQATNVLIAAKDVSPSITRALSMMLKHGATRIKELIKQVPRKACADAIAGPLAIAVDPSPHLGERPWLPLGRTPDQRAVVLGVPLARFSPDQLESLAEIMEARGIGDVRLTPWQSLVLPVTHHSSAKNVETELASAGFDIECPEVHVVACAGSTGCLRTTMDTKHDAAMLRSHLAKHSTNMHRADKEMPIVHLSGCARSCAMTSPADVLALANDGTNARESDSTTYALYVDARPASLQDIGPIRASVRPSELTSTISALSYTSGETIR
ncbi:MAG: precorrin-3B synthase [Pseudomonadota bacterium]